MIAKFGFIFVVAIFGVLMFIAGVIAPESIRIPVDAFAKQTVARVTSLRTEKAAGASATDPASGGVAAPVVAEAAAIKPDPIWEESLLVPTPAPEKAQYGLQAGRFAHAADADALAERVKALHLPLFKVLDVVDKAGIRSSIVAVGPYASQEEARTARPAIARDLSLTGPLTLILLPASTAGAATMPAVPVASPVTAPASLPVAI